jgi:LmbE family N-acetylglucosaminyl deacetylase
MAAEDAYAFVYLSPHLDDAVLSCGGRIWQQAQAGAQVAVVTVFAGAQEPGQSLSPFADAVHERWGHPIEAVLARREEDLQALSILGAKAVHWPYTDCIYRTTAGGDFAYDSEQALWGDIHPDEAILFQVVRERIGGLPLLPQGTLFIPLAVGMHVDHRIVRQAAEGSEHPWVAFEDFPYAEDEGASEAALAGGAWQEELAYLSAEALEAKTAAIACYRSQISTFWQSTADMAAALHAFAERTGAGEPAERYWIPTRPLPEPAR